MEDNNFYVYCLCRPDKRDPFDLKSDRPFYIGKGHRNRYLSHRQDAHLFKDKVIDKYYNPIKMKIILSLWRRDLDFSEKIIYDGCTENEAFEFEHDAIVRYGRIDLHTGCLSNLTDGGEGPANRIPWNLGIPRTNRVKHKLRMANLGKKYSSETNIKKGRKGRIAWNKGVHHTEETKRKISESCKGKPCWSSGKHLTEETKKKISLSLLGRVDSAETRRKKSVRMIGNTLNYGKHHSEITKQKMRDSHKGLIISEETRQKMSIAAKQRILRTKAVEC